jgi:hypothetical protein
MTGTDLCVNKPHKSQSYLNHLVYYTLKGRTIHIYRENYHKFPNILLNVSFTKYEGSSKRDRTF